MSVQVEGYRNESFESLEAAVLETSRGRWFLEEYARRQRSAETLAILEILKKLENSVTSNSFMPAPKGAEPAQPIKTEQLKFFKQDEELFVEPAVAAPSLTVVKSPPVAEASEPKGAKLKIQRLQPSQSTEEPVAVEPEKPAAPVAAPEPVASVASPPPSSEPKQRVVIIRRPASEAAEIPLMEENKAEVAA